MFLKKTTSKKKTKGTIGKRVLNKKSVKSASKKKSKNIVLKREYIRTYVPGLDDIFEKGVPRNSSVLVAGGSGSGKTLLCLQILASHAMKGKKCLFITFEELPVRLFEHLEDFGWDIDKLKSNLKIIYKEPSIMAVHVEALLANTRGELLIDVNEILEIIPNSFRPDFIAVDSISAIESSFAVSKNDDYRTFLEQFFYYLRSLNVTSFLISETDEVPTSSSIGVERFLGDGVLLLYNFRKGNIRERGLEVLKMRSSNHKKQIFPYEIGKKGISVFTKEELFGGFDDE